MNPVRRLWQVLDSDDDVLRAIVAGVLLFGGGAFVVVAPGVALASVTAWRWWIGAPLIAAVLAQDYRWITRGRRS